VLRDVAAHVILGRGSIAFPRLKLATQEGLGVDVEGNLDGLGAKPRGHVAGTVSAATPAALSKLLRLVEVAETEGPTEKVLDAVLPFRLAGRLDLGTRIETAADLTFDGLVKGRRATGAVLLDGGRDSWREAACDISLQLDHPDAVSLIGLVTGRAPAGSGGRTARPGKVVLKAVGTPSAGLLSLASVQADGLELAYHGQVTMVGDVASSIDGELDIKAQSAEDALALAGLTAGNAIAGRPVEGLVDIVSQGDRLTLAPQQVAFGGTEVSGQVTITRPAGKPAHISGDLTADAATVPGLLSAMLERSAGRPTDVPPSVWPDQLFDFSSTERINGQLGLTVARLELEPGLAARDVRLVLRVQPGRLSVDDIAGEALGGKLGGQLRFERVPGATTLEGTLAIARARLETLAVAGTPPRATGEPLDLSLGFSGRAASPAALVVALKGKGEARLGAAHMTGFAPASVARGIDALLVAKAEINAETLGKALAQSLPTGQLPLGPSEIPIEIVDGAARVAPFTVDSPEGRTTVRTTVDLSTLQVDAEWRIEASAGFRSLLPAVSVVYVGKLRDAASLEPRVQTGSLERELAVRKMERDVEELERLRKADEERARQEQERQRQEQERQRQEAERVRQEQERLRALQQLPPQQPPPVAPAPPPAQGTSRPAGAIDTPGGWGAAAIPAPPQPGEPAAAQNGAAPPGSTAAPPQPVPPAPRPAARPQPKRSPGEEVLRQLGP
jgi:hypothetical protein